MRGGCGHDLKAGHPEWTEGANRKLAHPMLQTSKQTNPTTIILQFNNLFVILRWAARTACGLPPRRRWRQDSLAAGQSSQTCDSAAQPSQQHL